MMPGKPFPPVETGMLPFSAMLWDIERKEASPAPLETCMESERSAAARLRLRRQKRRRKPRMARAIRAPTTPPAMAPVLDLEAEAALIEGAEPALPLELEPEPEVPGAAPLVAPGMMDDVVEESPWSLLGLAVG